MSTWSTDGDPVERRISRWKIEGGTLDLSNLGLNWLPQVLSTHDGRIDSLNISNNQIKFLPSWLCDLDIEVLDISGNRLSELPNKLGNMTGLRHLAAANNQLVALDRGLMRLPLETLELSGNDQLKLPHSLSTAAPREILAYYFESRADEGAPLQEMKLLLVGRGKAGKTTITKQLAGEEPDSNEPETHSISIRQIQFECPSGSVSAHVWDFGGQEILHSTHRFFLTERSLYVVVLEPRTGSAQHDADYWLKLIETQGGASPTIVVLNWSHGRPWRIDDVRLKRQYRFVAGIVSIDALAGEGIDALNELIVSVAEARMPDVWLPFPKKWRQIKDAVATMKENFLSFEQYAQLCSRLGEENPEAQANLAGILHALGLVLYFGNDRRLQDTRVLNPSWVTGGVYAVIRAQRVAAAHGQLSVIDMPSVLAEAEGALMIRASDYPEKTHWFILELMRAFQLCYSSHETSGRPTQYLVPELLPEFEPEMARPFERAPIKLRYRYEIVHPGLLPRFIARTHELSDGAPQWRHGVVLRHADAEALVRTEAERRELQVFVAGGDGDVRQVTVAMVRREIHKLHAEMNIDAVEELQLAGDSGQWISVRSLAEVEEPERRRIRLPVQPDGTAEVDVTQELDKLTPSVTRAEDRDPSTMRPPVRLFVSYARDDERRLRRLDAILDVLEQQHGLTAWRDRRLIAGDEWDRAIRSRLDEMDIFLFVASQTSLVQPYIRDPEVKRALRRHELDRVEICVVKLEACACEDDAELGRFQRLGVAGRSIVEARERSVAWEEVRKGLLPVIERVRRRKSR